MALANFVTDAALKSAVASALGVASSSDLPALWDGIIAAANATATNNVYEALCSQGFTVDQVSQWVMAPAYALDQGTFWALVRGAGLGAYSGPKMDHLDHREELRTKSVLILDGVATAVTPGESDVGGISFGISTGGVSASDQFEAFNNGSCAGYFRGPASTSCGC